MHPLVQQALQAKEREEGATLINRVDRRVMWADLRQGLRYDTLPAPAWWVVSEGLCRVAEKFSAELAAVAAEPQRSWWARAAAARALLITQAEVEPTQDLIEAIAFSAIAAGDDEIAAELVKLRMERYPTDIVQWLTQVEKWRVLAGWAQTWWNLVGPAQPHAAIPERKLRWSLADRDGTWRVVMSLSFPGEAVASLWTWLGPHVGFESSGLLPVALVEERYAASWGEVAVDAPVGPVAARVAISPEAPRVFADAAGEPLYVEPGPLPSDAELLVAVKALPIRVGWRLKTLDQATPALNERLWQAAVWFGLQGDPSAPMWAALAADPQGTTRLARVMVALGETPAPLPQGLAPHAPEGLRLAWDDPSAYVERWLAHSGSVRDADLFRRVLELALTTLGLTPPLWRADRVEALLRVVIPAELAVPPTQAAAVNGVFREIFATLHRWGVDTKTLEPLAATAQDAALTERLDDTRRWSGPKRVYMEAARRGLDVRGIDVGAVAEAIARRK